MNNLSSENFDTETFQKFTKYIYKKTGIVVSDNKKSHLGNRLRGRIKQLNLQSFGQYWDYLMLNESDTNEIYILFDAVSTNETYFQRAVSHFKILENFVLPEFYNNKKKEVSIWSCGSSTGEEAYDIGMIAMEFENTHPGIEILVTGTDISNKALQMAKIGEYSDRRIDKLTPLQIEKYFQKVNPKNSSLPHGKNVIKVKDSLKNKVTFHFLNLISDSYLLNVDVIFCRNVMIYFDLETQIEILEKLSRSLKPGGYLFLGPSESIQLYRNSLKIIETPDGNVLKKDNVVV